MYPRSDELFTCGAGLGKVAIDPYGVAYPCLHLRAPGFGRSVRDGGLDAYVCQDIPRLRDRRASAPEYLGRCGRCFLRGLCEQCPGKAWIEHGTVDAPVDYLCEVAHAQARAIGLLGPDERAWQIDDFHTRVAGLVARTRDENDEDMERGATG
jgi:radical SAM protein with 4Fe4S-binding SPASM domain